MGGKRVVILVDASTSMLDRTIVNILRRRNMSPEQQQRAPKWQQAVNTVDWLTTQIEIGTQRPDLRVQQTRRSSLIEGTDGQWLTVTNGSRARRGRGRRCAEHGPQGATSLHVAFNAAAMPRAEARQHLSAHRRLADDGRDHADAPGRHGRERLDHFNRAVRELPIGAPSMSSYFAMEGDPRAAPAYWWLALRTGGSMLAPVGGLAIKRKREEIDMFSMSFVDSICCGFGSIILLLVVTQDASRRARGKPAGSAGADRAIRAGAQRDHRRDRDRAARRGRRRRATCVSTSCRSGPAAPARPDSLRAAGATEDSEFANELRRQLARAKQTLTRRDGTAARRLQAADRRLQGRRHSGRQRVHRVPDRYVGQHAAVHVGPSAATDAGDARGLSDASRASR